MNIIFTDICGNAKRIITLNKVYSTKRKPVGFQDAVATVGGSNDIKCSSLTFTVFTFPDSTFISILSILLYQSAAIPAVSSPMEMCALTGSEVQVSQFSFQVQLTTLTIVCAPWLDRQCQSASWALGGADNCTCKRSLEITSLVRELL